MEQRNNDVVEIDVKELLLVMLHKWWIILLVGIVGATATGIISKYIIQSVYTSTSKIYVISRQDETKMTLSDLQTGTQLTKDYMILVKSRPVTEQVISNLNLGMTQEQLAEIIKVNTPEDTRILEIAVKYPDALMAKQIVDALAEVSSERMVSVMAMEKVNIVEEGNLPSEPSSPNIKRNTLLGGMVGIVLASFITVIIYMMNDSIKTSEDIEKYLGITTLGIIPLEEGTNKKIKKVKMSRRSRKAVLAS
jgi:capsular polysaccharide biosynthesis protein